MSAAAAVAFVGGSSGTAHNNSSAAAPPPNLFALSPAYAAGLVSFYPPGAPAAAGQPILVVKRTFTPTLYDELAITLGERVRVITIYDDGWCNVRKLGAGGEEGVVPYECLGNPGDRARQGRAPRRTTS
jgi:hypothetical protein